MNTQIFIKYYLKGQRRSQRSLKLKNPLIVRYFFYLKSDLIKFFRYLFNLKSNLIETLYE